jgi:predicted phosphodiesterase
LKTLFSDAILGPEKRVFVLSCYEEDESMIRKKSIMAAALAAVLACQTFPAFGGAAPDGKTLAQDTEAAQGGAYDAWKERWKELSGDWTQVSITPGADETQMNFAWYSRKGEDAGFRYGKQADLSDGTDAEVKSTDAQEGYQSNKVTLTGLEPGSVYYYQAGGKAVSRLETRDPDSFSFIFVGDPQIGSSNEEKAKKPEDILKDTFKTAQYESVMSDSFNWNHTLELAVEKAGSDPAFVLSAGDQIQTNAKKVKDGTVSEIEYAGYLSPEVLKSLPVATTVGNHDADNANYTWHFNVPNLSTLGSNGIVGGDYSFRYGDALFMMLNTQDTNVAEHRQFMEETIKANADCKWRIVTLHQDIYGSAEHSNEPEITNLRYELVPIFEENDVDVVLTGHDHAYSRTYLLEGGKKSFEYDDDSFEAQLEKDIDNGDSKEILFTAPLNIKKNTVDPDEITYLQYLAAVMDTDAIVSKKRESVDPEGILYMTAGSSSGSKYYDLTPRKQTYIASRWQEDVPTYSVVDIDSESFTINTYRTDTNEKIDEQVRIVKTK